MASSKEYLDFILGQLSELEDIADYTELPLETVKELESQLMQLA
jgi:hypothetical protein